VDSEVLVAPIDLENINENWVGGDWEIINETSSKDDKWILQQIINETSSKGDKWILQRA